LFRTVLFFIVTSRLVGDENLTDPFHDIMLWAPLFAPNGSSRVPLLPEGPRAG
jgi:hypothetical protein